MSTENRPLDELLQANAELVQALRQYDYWLAGPDYEDESSLVRGAADELERLQREKDAALHRIDSLTLELENTNANLVKAIRHAHEVGDRFKNFHRLLCERFGYVHDEKDWQRDQLSLIEWIAEQP